MKKFILCFVMLSFSIAGFAIPAKRGLWKTLKLANGKEVRARLVGDEVLNYYESEGGECYVSDSKGVFQKADKVALAARTKERRAKVDAARRAKAIKRVGGVGNVYEGKKKGLIILVQFADKAFKSGHDLDFYKRVANEPGFTTPDGFNGSVSDYFKDQSMGKFELDFDVVGPVTLPNDYAYYGQNRFMTGDAHAGEMVAEACKAVADQVNFADYDWASDGEVDQVFVLYSGLGEAAGGSADTVWPHMWNLADSDYGQSLDIDGVRVNTYACSCEMTLDERIGYKEVVDGIGTICHEFSHCLGYADMYDTSSYGATNFGMDKWDLMDYGSYNDGGFTPSGYTAYEKWVAGWIEPVELTDDTEIRDLKPVSEGGNAYVIFNSGNQDEFIMIENRSQTGWDAAQPASGLMVMHVDYDESVWESNTVNNDGKRQRCTIFHADNSAGSSDEDLAGDVYPYGDNDALNSIAYPKPIWYSVNADGKRALGMSVAGMTRNSDGTVGFTFHPTPVERDAFVLLETFDDNNKDGGNDGSWTGMGGPALLTDLAGWTGVKQYAGYQCARFGTKSTPGSLTSPEFEVEQGSTLTCLAAPWDGESCTMTVSFISSDNDAETVLGTFAIEENAWKGYEMKIAVGGKGKLKFASSMRQFLDEVRVSIPVTDGIDGVGEDKDTPADGRIYSIDGRYLGRDLNVLGHGLYIMNGKKIVK